jgi:hypothetical protein
MMAQFARAGVIKRIKISTAAAQFASLRRGPYEILYLTIETFALVVMVLGGGLC